MILNENCKMQKARLQIANWRNPHVHFCAISSLYNPPQISDYKGSYPTWGAEVKKSLEVRVQDCKGRKNQIREKESRHSVRTHFSIGKQSLNNYIY